MKSLAIVGGAGRMGQTLARGLSRVDDVRLVALVDAHEPAERFGATYASSLEELRDLDVVVDFSSPEGVLASATYCAANHVVLIVGTTGLSSEQRGALEQAASVTGVLVAANFSIGAVLSERFAAQAAPYFERVEIIELHHDQKVDAPSGTSISAATAIAAARRAAHLAPLGDPTSRHSVEGARGADVADGIKVHSVRLPGLVAHQEIHFGAPGEGLTLRHDSFDRESFVAGVALAVRAMDATPGLREGLGSLL